MSQVGLEPTILAFERTKTLHALNRAITVIVKKEYSAENWIMKFHTFHTGIRTVSYYFMHISEQCIISRL
jgi:hypothetical protein